MKKRFTLLTAGMFLFAGIALTGCNTALTEKTGLVKAESGCEINAASFLRAAGGGFSEKDEFSVKLSFVGDAPLGCICEPEDLTLTGTMAELGEKSFSITNVMPGSKLQFSLEIIKNGKQHFIGKTDQIVVGLGKDSVYVDIEKVYDFVPVWSKNDGKLVVADSEVIAYDPMEFLNHEKTVSLVFENKGIADFVVDNNHNIYVLYFENGGSGRLETIIKYDVERNYENVMEFQPADQIAPGYQSQLYFEPETETVYYFLKFNTNNETEVFYLYEKTSEKNTFIKKSEITYTPEMKNVQSPFSDSRISLDYLMDFDFAVSGKNLYLLLKHGFEDAVDNVLFNLSTWDVSENTAEKKTDFKTLFAQYSNKLIEPAGLLTNHSVSGTLTNFPYNMYFQNINSNCCKFTDISSSGDYLYLLFQNQKSWFDLNSGWNNSRGCVLQLKKTDFSCEECFGWTYEPKVQIQTDPDDPESVKNNYLPENIEKGFFGPEKIISVDGAKIDFMDSGVSLVKNGETYERVNQNHLVSLNKDDGKWTYTKVYVVLGTEIGGY